MCVLRVTIPKNFLKAHKPTSQPIKEIIAEKYNVDLSSESKKKRYKTNKLSELIFFCDYLCRNRLSEERKKNTETPN